MFSVERYIAKDLWSRIKLILMILAVLVIIPVIINLFFANRNQFRSLDLFIDSNLYGFTLGLVFWLGNWVIGTITARRLSWRKNLERANMISLLSFIGYGVLISLATPFVFFTWVWDIPKENMAGAVVGHAFSAITVDMIIISIYYSRYIVRYWGESIKNEEKLKQENLIARYEALKNQVNPHFLFNSLNTLTGVVEKNPERASEYIRKLSDIYRYVLDQKDKEIIPIRDELRFVDDYIYLSKIRHGEGLIVLNRIRNYDRYIVPLGLQMLIENAVKHNIISDDQPLTIEYGEQDDYIYVRNNMQRRKVRQSKNAVGLENLIKRYEFLNNRKVIVNRSEDYFEVKLPSLENLTQ